MFSLPQEPSGLIYSEGFLHSPYFIGNDQYTWSRILDLGNLEPNLACPCGCIHGPLLDRATLLSDLSVLFVLDVYLSLPGAKEPARHGYFISWCAMVG